MKQQNSQQPKQTDVTKDTKDDNDFASGLARALVKDWRANGMTRNLHFRNTKRKGAK